jgi:choline-sulfatase
MSEGSETSRRDLLKAGLATAATGLVAPAAAAAAAKTKKPGKSAKGRPNILFLLVDEQRYPVAYESAALKAFRDNHLPAQKALAERGLVFERHYAASVACVPSRTSLYTGHYPSLHGVANTDGAAKTPDDPEMFWLAPNTVPTFGHYLRAGGYRTFWKGKWHASETDLHVPGTRNALTSYDENGVTDSAKEHVYLAADQLDKYGFTGWVGPEAHGSDPLRSGSSAGEGKHSRDPAIAQQVVGLFKQLESEPDDSPWFIMASFTNPHDIALWGYATNLAAAAAKQYDFSVGDDVPHDLFDQTAFHKSRGENLKGKPSCQKSYKDAYDDFMQPSSVNERYFRLYYQLHQNVDRHLGEVYDALKQSPFFDNTIVVFTSDHGDLLGSHGGLYQKWYTAYDEAVRVPLIIALPGQEAGTPVTVPTSHIDLAPTLLGFAGIDPEEVRKSIADDFSDAVPMVGRDLSGLVRGEKQQDAVAEPIYFMTDDDPSRGLDQKNFIGIAYDAVTQPNHIETIIAGIDGELWKFSRYFDNPQYWSDPGTPGGDGVKDLVVKQHGREKDDEGTRRRMYEQRVKTTPLPDEWEMYNLSKDPMELTNLVGNASYGAQEAQLRQLLAEQCSKKRLRPLSGPVPGATACVAPDAK